VTQPIGKLEDVPVNIGDIWVLDNFIVVDMPETDDTQIIPGRPILAPTGCHIDVREDHIFFEVEGRFAMFTHRKEDAVSPRSSILDALPLSHECDMEDVLHAKDPLDSEWIYMRTLIKGMLRWSFLLQCHLTNLRLRPLLLMIPR